MARPQRANSPRRSRRRWLRYLLVSLVLVVVFIGLGVGVSAVWVLTILPRSLPSVASLESFDPSEGTRVYDENDEQITELHVERRIFVPLAQIPKALRDAIIATEDARFYSHHGVDPAGIARAVYQNFRRGRIVEGGSTITQQLAKNLFFTTHKSITRKLREVVVTRWLEADLSKRRILEIYLNVIEWGDGIYGCEGASQRYFGKRAADLDAEEAAGLAAMIPSPRRINPRANPALYARAQRRILWLMEHAGYVKRSVGGLGALPPEPSPDLPDEEDSGPGDEASETH